MTKFVSGQWNAICDRCGFKFKSSELRKDWQGLMVDEKCYEARHPQDLIKIKPEKAIPEWVRPRPDDFFPFVCFIWTQGAFADLGTADCMKADNNSSSYSFLLALRDNNA